MVEVFKCDTWYLILILSIYTFFSYIPTHTRNCKPKPFISEERWAEYNIICVFCICEPHTPTPAKDRPLVRTSRREHAHKKDGTSFLHSPTLPTLPVRSAAPENKTYLTLGVDCAGTPPPSPSITANNILLFFKGERGCLRRIKRAAGLLRGRAITSNMASSPSRPLISARTDLKHICRTTRFLDDFQLRRHWFLLPAPATHL